MGVSIPFSRYLAHKKTHPPRNLQQDYVFGPTAVLSRGRFFISEVTLYIRYVVNCAESQPLFLWQGVRPDVLPDLPSSSSSFADFQDPQARILMRGLTMHASGGLPREVLPVLERERARERARVCVCERESLATHERERSSRQDPLLLLITSPYIAHCLLITSPYIAHCLGACTTKGS